MAGNESAAQPGAAELPEIDTSVAHAARVYDYLLGSSPAFDLVDPGVVQQTRWRPDPAGAVVPTSSPMWCAVGRKP